MATGTRSRRVRGRAGAAQFLPVSALVTAVVTAFVTVLVAGGCGGGSPASAPPGPGTATAFGPPAATGPSTDSDLAAVAAAVRTTLGQRVAVSFKLAASQVLGSTRRPVTGTGQFDLVSGVGRARIDQPSGPEQIVFLPASVFVSQAAGATLLPKGKVWISAGLTEQSLATNFPQFVTQVESLNPALLLSEIAWGAVSAAPIAGRAGAGSAYSVEVDLAKAQSSVAGPSAAAFQKAIGYQMLEDSGSAAASTQTVEVVVGRSGGVTALVSSPPGSGLGTISLVLSGTGNPVTVAQPPRAQVVDISTLAPGGERENAGGGDSDGA